MRLNQTRILTAALLALSLSAGAVLAQTSQPASKPAAAAGGVNKAALMDPSKLTEKAPETFKVKFETSKGDFVVEATRAWSPVGAVDSGACPPAHRAVPAAHARSRWSRRPWRWPTAPAS